MDTKVLEELSVKIVRDAYGRGRIGLYLELFDDCFKNRRFQAAAWLMDKLASEVYLAAATTEELEIIDRARAIATKWCNDGLTPP